MKRILLFATLFLFSCQNFNLPKIEPEKEVSGEDFLMQAVKPTHSQFQSSDLEIMEVKDEKVKIALLFPLSGKNKDLGNSLVNSATLALFDYDKNADIELVLFDSGDSGEEVKKSFDEIVKQEIKIIIGPIFSSQVEEIAIKAIEKNITVISLSNNEKLANQINGEGALFLAGMLPETQVEQVVNYAINRGKYSFAVISPRNQYGKIITDLTKSFARKRDAHFITSEFYKNSDEDINRAVKNAINVFAISGHLLEGKNKLKKDAVISEKDRIYPQVIMIPESGKNLSKIVAAIKKQNVNERNIQIIGTSALDDISTINDLNLLGTWFAAPENDKFREFEKNYYRSFNKFPPRISAIAYDATLAVINLAQNKAYGEKINAQNFINANEGFAGIDGLFRFLPNGLVERNLAILQVGNGRFDVLERPNESFLKY
jgi:ABC-type branched-subunit amino acid transport system substrate-binding protein